MTELSKPLMASEARALTDEVKAEAAALWEKLLHLYEGGAHTVLGYSSWGAYYEAEFDGSGNYGYRLLKSAQVMEQLPNGNSRPATEAVARELVPLLRDDPDRVEEVWSNVVELHGPKPTAAQVRELVVPRDKPNTERAVTVAGVRFPAGGISETWDLTRNNVKDLKQVANDLLRRATPEECAALHNLFTKYAEEADALAPTAAQVPEHIQRMAVLEGPAAAAPVYEIDTPRRRQLAEKAKERLLYVVAVREWYQDKSIAEATGLTRAAAVLDDDEIKDVIKRLQEGKSAVCELIVHLERVLEQRGGT